MSLKKIPSDSSTHKFILNKKTFPLVLESSPKICKYILRYLSPPDVHNLMTVNKKVYKILTRPDHYLYQKYMLNYYKDFYLFLYQRKNELKEVLPKFIDIIKHSDTLYKEFYLKANCLVVIYYFCGLFLILDIFVLLLIFHKIIRGFGDFYPHIPIIVFWLLSLLVLIVNFILEKILEVKLDYFINEKLPGLEEKTKGKLIRNISYRLRNQQPISYKPVAFIVLLCYIPIFCKFLTTVDYKTTCIVVAVGLALIFFVFDFIRMYISKYNNNEERIQDYKYIFYNNDYFKKKRHEDVKKKEIRSCLDEGWMMFLFIFWKMIIFILVIYYAYIVGKKIDDPDYDVEWKFLLVPVDLVGVLLILWGCLYICSTRNYKIKKKWILYCTIIIMMIGAGINIIAFPNILNSEIHLTPYFPLIVDLVISIAATVHFITLKILRETDSVYEFD